MSYNRLNAQKKREEAELLPLAGPATFRLQTWAEQRVRKKMILDACLAYFVTRALSDGPRLHGDQ